MARRLHALGAAVRPRPLPVLNLFPFFVHFCFDFFGGEVFVLTLAGQVQLKIVMEASHGFLHMPIGK